MLCLYNRKIVCVLRERERERERERDREIEREKEYIYLRELIGNQVYNMREKNRVKESERFMVKKR